MRGSLGHWSIARDGSGLPDRELIGGKAWSVARMRSLGFQVPPAFVVTTRACTAFFEAGAFPEGLEHELAAGISWLEAQSGRRFGMGPNPLLVSVRSGAPISMPGMMDTVLNLGLNDETVRGLAARSGERFAWDCYRRFVSMYGGVVLGLGDEPFDQIFDGIKRERHAATDSDLGAADLAAVVKKAKAFIQARTGHPVPDQAREQLSRALTNLSEG